MAHYKNPIADIANTSFNASMESLPMIARELKNRVKPAIMGFGYSMAPIVTFVFIYFTTYAGSTILFFKGDNLIHTIKINNIVNDLIETITYLATIFAVYWGIAAIAGTKEFLHIKRANILLAIAMAVYGFRMIIHEILSQVSVQEFACRIRGIPNTNLPPTGFDDRAPCATFVDDLDLTIGLAFAFITLLVLVMSLVLRTNGFGWRR
ncbi:hypothetical protein C7451_11318 [Blastomonas natatoria]|uniref:Uncharacterized protein n=1 Tax=Blastomonas natatoria TaxID=34015 RepID=A0A2V3USC9_9SPHN|nr:hypothetical protein [Blastomonas natatoria]PXW71272.1 hypothetical protein C7451_11318 [Blastomonas natatoria]